MTRKQIKGILECLHILFLFATIVPGIYMLGMQREPGVIYRLYLASYILLVPFAGFKTAKERCRSLWQYLLLCIGIAAITIAMAFGIATVFLPDHVFFGYLFYVVIIIIAAALREYSVRINKVRKQKAKEEMDQSWRENSIFLNRPRMVLGFWFVILYVMALNFACAEICNIALVSAICYLLTAISYQYIEKMEHYLDMNGGVCQVRNIPQKRLFGIGKIFLLSYLAIIFLSIIPACMTISHRDYKDLRQWVLEREPDYEELYAYENHQTGNGDPMWDVVDSYGPIQDTPILIKLLFYSIGAAFAVFLLILLIRWVYHEIIDFSRNVNEEDDWIEMLEQPDVEESIFTRRSLFKKSEGNNVRSQYRRYIRKHRKDRPAPYETPAEIEVAAGIADTDEGKELHYKYEKVRYGN